MAPYGGLGCNTQVLDGTELLVDGSLTTVDQAVLAVHGVYIAWGSDDQPDSSSFAMTSHSSTSTEASLSSTPATVPYTTIATSTSTSRTSATTARSTSAPVVHTTPISPPDPQSSAPASTVTTAFPPTPTVPLSASQGLLKGVKAGIGVGVSIAALAVVAAAAWFIIFRRRKSSEETDLDSQLPMYDDKKGQVMESKSPHISELSGDTGRSELMGSAP